MLRIGLLICTICFLSCSTVTSESGKSIVNNSIETHGGYGAFQELESVSFSKTTRLYKEDGSLESETFQDQSFTLIPKYSMRIKWMDGNDQHQITYDRNTLIKLVNNEKIEDQGLIESALKLALSAEYVFFQPFKLIDDNGQLSYDGKQMVGDVIETSVVAIKYEDDSPSSDAWRYYFDDNYRLVAASVKHNNRISFIENLDFQTYKGILFNKVRKSYFVDSLFQKKQLRAEYRYDIIDTRQ
tara:strand:- start:304 stop:1029 length:726 start_codon:yes stop_codon:yes gene_type:complete